MKTQSMKANWQGWVQVKWKPGTPETAWKSWTKSKSIKYFCSTKGNWNCTVWIEVSTKDKFEKLVWKNIRNIKYVENTESFWAKQWWGSNAA